MSKTSSSVESALSQPKKATLKDVAKAANVSIASASNVLNGRTKKVTKETAESILAAAKQLGYSKNINALALRKGTSQTILVIMPKSLNHHSSTTVNSYDDNPFFSDFLTGVQKSATRHNYQFVFTTIQSRSQIIDIQNQSQPHGVIILGHIEKEVETVIANWHIKTIVVDNNDFFKNNQCSKNIIDYSLDDYLIGKIAANHALSLGHTRITLLFGHLTESSVHRQRYLGIKDALTSHGVKDSDLTLLETEPTFNGAERRFPEVLDTIQKGSTAVICMTDILALNCLKQAALRGLTIPDSFSLMGMDSLQLLKYMPLELTTISQFISDRGYQAVNLLLDDHYTKQEPILVKGNTMAARRSHL